MHYPNLRRHLILQKKWLFASAALLITQAALIVATPLPLKALIDGLFTKKHSSVVDTLTKHNYDTHEIFLILIGAVALFAVITALMEFFEEYVLNAASHHVMESIRHDLTSVLLTRKLSAVERRRKIDLMSRLSGDVSNLDVLIINGLGVFVRAIPTLIMVLISMFITDWRFSAILIVAVPLMAWIGYYFSARLKNEMRCLRYALNDYELDTTQTLESLPLVKSLAIEETVRASLFARITNIRVFTLISRISQGSLVASLFLVRSAVRLGVLLIGGYGILRGDFSIGTLVVFLAYTESLAKPVNELSKFSSKWAKAVTSVHRFEELYSDFATTGETSGDINQVNQPVTLEFINVSHTHFEGPRVLENFSAHFAGGNVVGIVGPSGTGKSSFIRLLNRLSDPNAGLITLAGQDVRHYQLDYLRQQVTLVYQEPFFVHGSIRANLSLVRPGQECTDAELWSALAKVNAETFVRELPLGLDTVIGEGARRLSGGQTQRLNLARAFLRSPSLVYVFDEATSGLDPVSARIVLNSARKLKETGALVFWITHRQEELEHCDQAVHFRFDGNPRCSPPTGQAAPELELNHGLA